MSMMSFDPENRPPYRRPMAEILADLAQEVPPDFLAEKEVPSKGGKQGYTALFIPWYKVLDILDWYAPGWCHEIRAINGSGKQTIITVRLIIPTAEGDIYREATGIEDDDLEGFGDTASNACAQAVRRAFAMFGGGRALWDRKKRPRFIGGKDNNLSSETAIKKLSPEAAVPVPLIDRKLSAVLERFPVENPEEEKRLVAEALQWKMGKPIGALSDEEKKQLHEALVAKLRATAPNTEKRTKTG
jgi:hypothetical protein